MVARKKFLSVLRRNYPRVLERSFLIALLLLCFLFYAFPSFNASPVILEKPDHVIDIVDVTESDQIGLTSFIFYEYGDVTYSNDDQIWLVSRPGFFDGHLEKVDADYIFATGYFPLLPDQREAFSVGMVYGWNETLSSLGRFFQG